MSDHTSLRRSFDAVATLYDEVRPGYPDMTINAIIQAVRAATRRWCSWRISKRPDDDRPGVY